MLSAEIHKDLTRYRAKVVGGLSARALVCSALALACGLAVGGYLTWVLGLEARGTTREAAEAAMAEWCALWRPTATTATWTRVVEEDHGERTHRLFFELDDQRASNVTLVVGMDDGSLSVEEGGR